MTVDRRSGCPIHDSFIVMSGFSPVDRARPALASCDFMTALTREYKLGIPVALRAIPNHAHRTRMNGAPTIVRANMRAHWMTLIDQKREGWLAGATANPGAPFMTASSS